DTLVREVMTPRPDIVAIREDATIGDLRALFREQEYSRFPVFKDSLGDGDLAQILTYVRAAWGNKAKPMTAEDFTAVRNGPQPSASGRLQAH
ncbi:MAG: CBS domain-containing protein, partial [Phenylobacterium sp.]